MFNLRNYIKQGYLDAVGKMPDFWIIINSTGYCEKGVLLQEDLTEIQAKIDEKNTPVVVEEELEEEE